MHVVSSLVSTHLHLTLLIFEKCSQKDVNISEFSRRQTRKSYHKCKELP